MLSKVPEGIEKVEIEGKGVGVRATKTFHKNEFICEYRGELIPKNEAQQREELLEDDDGCYMYYFEFKSKKLWYVLIKIKVLGISTINIVIALNYFWSYYPMEARWGNFHTRTLQRILSAFYMPAL